MKTTKEQRGAWRNAGTHGRDPRYILTVPADQFQTLLDDVDTLIAERDALRARVERLLAEWTEANRWLLAAEERRKLTGDALYAEAASAALRARVEKLREALGTVAHEAERDDDNIAVSESSVLVYVGDVARSALAADEEKKP